MEKDTIKIKMISKNQYQLYPITEDMIEIDKETFDNLRDGKIEWDISKQKFVDVVVAPPTAEELEANYHSKVEELIRKKYSMSDELGILRQRDTKVEEFEAYNAYCEQCKAEARREIYG